MALRFTMVVLLLCVQAESHARLSEDLAFINEVLGYSVENGHPTPDGERHTIPDSVFSADVKRLRNQISTLQPADTVTLRRFAYREDGRRAYFMVKLTDVPDELRLGYRSAHVGQNRLSELLDFLLLDITHHEPLALEEQIQLLERTGVFVQQDPVWQDRRAFRELLAGFLRTYGELKPSVQSCIKQRKYTVTLKPKQFQPEDMADTSILRMDHDGRVMVTEDRAAELPGFLGGRCSA